MRSRFILACSLAYLLPAINATLAPPAFCADPQWVVVDEDKDSSFSYDKSGTSKPKEGIVRVRTRVVYTKEGKAEALKMLTSAKNLANLYESRYLHDLDCTERESHLLGASHLDKEGVTLKQTDLAAVTEWEGIPPETRMATVFKKLCTQ